MQLHGALLCCDCCIRSASAAPGSCRFPASAARVATVQRQTKETSVKVTINLDGTGKCHSKSQVGAMVGRCLAAGACLAARAAAPAQVVLAAPCWPGLLRGLNVRMTSTLCRSPSWTT